MTRLQNYSWLYYTLALLLFSCSAHQKEDGLPFYNTPDFTPQWLSKTDANYASIHTIAPFSFVNQDGKTITSKDVEQKIYVASFFFTRCGSICPRMNENLQAVAKAFAGRDDVMILSHSVTPNSDSVKQLAKYAADHNINSKHWWLLTGDKEAIYTLARQSYFADEETGYNKTSREFLHTENCVLIDGHGRIRGVYNVTLPLEINKLVEHINVLLQRE